jgi:hypothetical protein
MIEELKNKKLYNCGENYVNNCIDFCKKFNKNIKEDYNIFLYWIGDNVNYKHSLVIKSFLTTQDLKHARLKIYSDKDLSKKEIFKPFLNYSSIQFYIFDVYDEIKGTIFEDNFLYTNQIKNHEYNSAYESDFFRVLMLNKYGGFYIDFDVLILRDLSPLLKYDFLYQWGCEKDYPLINGAIMHLRKNSDINNLMSELLIKSGTRPGNGSLHWASDLYNKVRNQNENLIVFPSCFFNSEWGLTVSELSLLEPLTKHKFSDKFFNGPFTWHWHNRWEEEIKEGSKFDLMDKRINKIYYENFNHTRER